MRSWTDSYKTKGPKSVQDPKHLLPSEPGQTVVLIAEDEVMLRNMVRIALEEEGYFVLTAGDGEQALTLSRQFPSTIHALLTDIKMPNLNGLELRKTILTERPGIKVLLMSGYTDRPLENIPILLKPFGASVLTQRMRELLVPAASDPA
jgi:two-component system, cell cycle sensor histidine kinase and response regulator CckA